MAEIPEHILRRSAEARAKAEGRSVEEVLAELKGEAPAADAPPAAPAAEPPGDAAAGTEPEPAAAATAVAVADPPAGGPVRDLAAESQQYGVPPPLLRRAALARARWDGLAPPQFAGEAATAAAPPPAAAAAPVAPLLRPSPPSPKGSAPNDCSPWSRRAPSSRSRPSPPTR